LLSAPPQALAERTVSPPSRRRLTTRDAPTSTFARSSSYAPPALPLPRGRSTRARLTFVLFLSPFFLSGLAQNPVQRVPRYALLLRVRCAHSPRPQCCARPD
jgi:hypothetical protein